MTWKEFISPLSTLLTLETGISIFALKIGCLGNSLLRTAAEDQWVPVGTSCYKIWASIYVFQLMTRLDVMNKLYIYWNKCSTCSTNKAYTCYSTCNTFACWIKYTPAIIHVCSTLSYWIKYTSAIIHVCSTLSYWIKYIGYNTCSVVWVMVINATSNNISAIS